MSEETQEPNVTAVPIAWHVPDDMIPKYATNFVVQFTGHEFVLSFFETRPPIVLGSPEEQREQLEKLGSVRANCVAQIVLSPTRMVEFIGLLNRHQEMTALQLSPDDEEE